MKKPTRHPSFTGKGPAKPCAQCYEFRPLIGVVCSRCLNELTAHAHHTGKPIQIPLVDDGDRRPSECVPCDRLTPGTIEAFLRHPDRVLPPRTPQSAPQTGHSGPQTAPHPGRPRTRGADSLGGQKGK